MKLIAIICSLLFASHAFAQGMERVALPTSYPQHLTNLIPTCPARVPVEVSGSRLVCGDPLPSCDPETPLVIKDGKLACGTASTVQIAKLGSGKRCKNDKWISACGYNTGNGWNYNVCYSRGHAVAYKWEVEYDESVKGYHIIGGSWPSYYVDLICDTDE